MVYWVDQLKQIKINQQRNVKISTNKIKENNQWRIKIVGYYCSMFMIDGKLWGHSEQFTIVYEGREGKLS